MPDFHILHHVKLQEPLQKEVFPYPENYTGPKNDLFDDGDSFSLVPGTVTTLHPEQIELARAALAERNANRNQVQTLIELGTIETRGLDPLMSFSHVDFDLAEKYLNLPNSRFVGDGGERSINERRIILREVNRYYGDGTDIPGVPLPTFFFSIPQSAKAIASGMRLNLSGFTIAQSASAIASASVATLGS